MTIDEYIYAQNTSIQERLFTIRKSISETIPEAEERISYKMPTFWKGRNIIHFAAFKNHIGIYPGGEATSFFADKLKDYKTSKGTIQIPNNKDVPLELIKEITKWCYERYKK
ncbi:iron chaperone [Butyrivibrio sp. LC3010]|uniref:iron chaperone n=1 Tax=Butyrivibrio sp. LC3010 TaxID=1280680 RepID=UPI000405D2FA|nr:DUF1801 domain-containing protein [Butyrivibrio sp. LC3010]